MDHDDYMRLALAQAALAREAGEVPVGAVVVLDGVVVGAGFNQPIAATDPTAHAEVVAVEPCLMCVGAMVHARIRTLVFGATEPRSGAIVSMASAHEFPGLNHRVAATGGVLEDECRAIIQEFFKARRATARTGDPE